MQGGERGLGLRRWTTEACVAALCSRGGDAGGESEKGFVFLCNYTHVLFGILHKEQVFLKGSVCFFKKWTLKMFWLGKNDHMAAGNGAPDPRLALLPACSLVALETG